MEIAMNRKIQDLVVIGGGIIGTLSAYMARKKFPQWSITVIDKGKIGNGASAYSAGLDAIQSSNAYHRRLAIRSQYLYQKIQNSIKNIDIFPIESIWVVNKKFEKKFYKEMTGYQGKLNQIDSNMLPKSPFKISSSQLFISDTHTHYANPGCVAQAIIQHLSTRPSFFYYESTEVCQIVKKESNLLVRLSDGRSIIAKKIILAIGPWIHKLFSEWFNNKKVRIKKIVALHLYKKLDENNKALIFLNDDCFFLPIKNKYLFSFCSREWDCFPDNGNLHISRNDLQIAKKLLARTTYGLENFITGAQVFCDAYTVNKLPSIEKNPDMQDLIVISGCSGTGFRIAPAVAEEAVKLLACERGNICV